MEQTCPTFLLEDGLDILKPRFILTFGNVPDGAISRLSGYQYLERASSEYLWRHRLAAKWGSAEVFAIPHPGALHDRRQHGHNELLTALRGQPPRS